MAITTHDGQEVSVSEIFQNEPKLRRLAPNSNWVEASLVAAQVHRGGSSGGHGGDDDQGDRSFVRVTRLLPGGNLGRWGRKGKDGAASGQAMSTEGIPGGQM